MAKNPAKEEKTKSNKARRAKQRDAYLASAKCLKRKEARIAKNLAKRENNKRPGMNHVPEKPEIPEINVRFNEGKTYHVLTIEQVVDGPRDRNPIPKELRDGALGNLTSQGGITFLTSAGKKWHMKFSELSFAINHNA